MTLTLHWPQIAFICMCAVNLCGEAFLHGQPKTGEHNFFLSVVSAIIGGWIFYCGGFFG